MLKEFLNEEILNRFKENPESVALIFDGKETSWETLHQLTKAYVALYTKNDISMGDSVAVMMPRSPELIAAILGLHVIGATCVPVDLDYPIERRNTLYSLAKVNYCIVNSNSNNFVEDKVRTLSFDPNSTFMDDLPDLPEVKIDKKGTAFIFFTSGTTGAPKGVVISNEAVHAGQSWLQSTFEASSSDVMLFRSSIGVTNLVREVYWPVLSGAKNVILGFNEHKDPNEQVKTIKKYGVTIFLAVPSLLSAMLGVTEFEECTSLRLVFGSSDLMSPQLPKKFYKVLPKAKLYNLYGLTEALYAGYYECLPDDLYDGVVPVGKNAELTMLILDDGDQLVSDGEIGFLCLGGVGIATSYLDNDDLNKEKFVESPPSKLGVNRMFRTGDLAKRNEKQEIILLGRSDDMVKIRGYRVETEEVASNLRSISGVKDAAVVGALNSDSTQHLMAYLEFEEGAAPAVGDMRAVLSEKLPEYMIPTSFARVDKIPTTSNGKVDRKSMKEKLVYFTQLASEYVSPESKNEIDLAQIWAEVLSIPQETIGLYDDFFQIGGDSIKGFLVSARLNSMGFNMPATQVFSSPTVSEMALQMELIGRDNLANSMDLSQSEAHKVFGWDEEKAAEILDTISR